MRIRGTQKPNYVNWSPRSPDPSLSAPSGSPGATDASIHVSQAEREAMAQMKGLLPAIEAHVARLHRTACHLRPATDTEVLSAKLNNAELQNLQGLAKTLKKGTYLDLTKQPEVPDEFFQEDQTVPTNSEGPVTVRENVVLITVSQQPGEPAPGALPTPPRVPLPAPGCSIL